MLIQFSEIRGAERVKKVAWKRTNLDLHKRNKSSIRIISSVKINVFRKELIFKCPIIVFLAFLLLFLWFYQFHLKKTYPYMRKENYSSSLREKCPNTEFFPVRIWIISRSVFLWLLWLICHSRLAKNCLQFLTRTEITVI